MSNAAERLIAGHAPRPERRESKLRGWFIRPDDSRWNFVMTNLSYGGCRLQTLAPLFRGEEIRLVVGDKGKIDAVVRWRRGDDVGLSFDPIDDKKVIARQADRARVEASVLVRRQYRRSQWLDAHDISPLGCCLNFVDVPRQDDLLWIQLPGLEALQGRVRWVEGHRAGLHFEKPIHPAVYSLLLEKWSDAA